ncbi:carboxypeptidase-like regulatory domain-containing protein [Aureibaculum luteum]|uniref:carboxypeptidase-like regulatory domain-containing protein n=1 Tax=Aureibaculum luteum TaxID=1548456 RepID=UPI000E4CE1E2|nr:carboxypeptidase-like regulatory domain-containing protein [Aureibaculum luteum]
MKNNTFLYIIFFLSSVGFAQQERITIYGNIKSDGAELENIHILNKNSKKGSITDSKGEFTIETKENDTLIITGIQFYYLEIPITNNHIKNKLLSIDLIQKTNELDEVEIKHNLTGNMTVDSDEIKIAKNVKDGVLDFSKIDLNLVSVKWDNASRSRTSSDSQLMPNMNLNLLAIAGFILKPIVKEVSKIGATKKNIKKMDRRYTNKVIAAPENIRLDFGDVFYTETLKIPPNHIEEFIASCLPKGIARLYADDKKIEIIDILISESKIYLEKIKTQN